MFALIFIYTEYSYPSSPISMPARHRWKASTYNWQSFPVGWQYRGVISLHSNLGVAQSRLVNFPLHYRSSNRLISLRRVAPIIVFYLSFRGQFTCASSLGVKETEKGKMKMLPLFTSTHRPLTTWHMERKKKKSNMNFVRLSVAFALRHMIQYVEPSRESDGKL